MDSKAIVQGSEGEIGVNVLSSGLVNEYFQEDGKMPSRKDILISFTK